MQYGNIINIDNLFTENRSHVCMKGKQLKKRVYQVSLGFESFRNFINKEYKVPQRVLNQS